MGEYLSLVGMADAPGRVAVPDVAEPGADAFFARKAGHHGVGQVELDLSIELIQQPVFVVEVGEESTFGDAGEIGDGGGGSCETAFREDLGGCGENCVAFVVRFWVEPSLPLLNECLLKI